MERRLAAILAADMVGYSRLMAADETGTIARQKMHRTALIDPKIAQYGGRIVKTTGDGMLAEFPSVVDAVQCAVEIQRAMPEREEKTADNNRIRYRVGINLGDIVIDDDDILGDGVNIAARLEGLSEPGGLCISDVVYQNVVGKLDLNFDDLGEQTLKNMERKVRAWKWTNVGGSTVHESGLAPASLHLPDKPSIAVLPFTNMSGDPEQEYFSDGITEDIITALSRAHWFYVTARSSSFTYKGKEVEANQVARDLGVAYVLKGSIRKLADRVRISAQLVEAATGFQVWAERYDREIEDIFALQDEIALHISGTLEPELERAEHRRVVTQRPSDLSAWDAYLRGMSFLYQFTKEGNREARALFEHAIAIDPDYARGFVGLAYSHHRDLFLGFADDRAQSIAGNRAAAQRAVALDNADSMAHFLLGCAYVWGGQFKLGIAEEKRAVELNPSNYLARMALGWTQTSMHEFADAASNMKAALALNPRDPRNHFYMMLLADNHMAMRDYETAASWAQKAIEWRSDFAEAHLFLAASLAHLGREAEAGKIIEDLETNTPGAAENRARSLESRNPADYHHFADGLRKAGLSI